MRSLITLLLLFSVYGSKAQRLQQDIKVQDVANMLYEQSILLSEKIHSSALNGTLPIYLNGLLTQKISPGDLKKMAMRTEKLSYPDPMFPDDPLMYVDSIIRLPFHPLEYRQIVLHEENLQYFMNDKEYVFFSRKELEPLLNENEKWLLAFWKRNVGEAIDLSFIQSISRTRFRFLATALYSVGLDQKEKPYKSDSLTFYYTRAEAVELGKMWVTQKILNPADSSISKNSYLFYFVPDSIQALTVSYTAVKTDMNTLEFELNAVAPGYYPMINNMQHPLESLFWINALGMNNHLGEDDKRLWKLVFFYKMRQQLHQENVFYNW